MKKILKQIIFGIGIILAMFGSQLLASAKTDRLEDRHSVLKFGYSYIDDNSQRLDSYQSYLRLKSDIDINNRVYTFIPIGLYKYEKRDNDNVNDKYLLSLLIETNVFTDYTGIYGKVSTEKDISNQIENRHKVGLGLYQYIFKLDTLILKFREGIQFVNSKYTIDNYLDTYNTYGKLSIFLGYMYNENVLFKVTSDYDIDYQCHNNILLTVTSMEVKIDKKLAVELMFTYEDNKNIPNDLRSVQKELVTSLVYMF